MIKIYNICPSVVIIWIVHNMTIILIVFAFCSRPREVVDIISETQQKLVENNKKFQSEINETQKKVNFDKIDYERMEFKRVNSFRADAKMGDLVCDCTLFSLSVSVCKCKIAMNKN